MSNRRLYNEKSFLVSEVSQFDEIWHLVGIFADGSIISKYPKTEYRIRIKPDDRWLMLGVPGKIIFQADRIYECESIVSVSRKHVYGSGKWFISPYRPEGTHWFDIQSSFFTYEDFVVG